jgi:small GTP-binding protein
MLNAEVKVTFRVVTIGDSSVGKTSIINRFLRDTFDTDEPGTIGVLYDSFLRHCDGTIVEIQLWDTAGQEQYRALGPVYFRNAAAALIVFDITNSISFQHLGEWLKSFRNVCADAAIVIIVGNKADLPDRVIQPEEAKIWAKASDAFYVETSAKTGQGVKILFDQLVTTLTPAVAAARGLTTPRTRPFGENPPQDKTCC